MSNSAAIAVYTVAQIGGLGFLVLSAWLFYLGKDVFGAAAMLIGAIYYLTLRVHLSYDYVGGEGAGTTEEESRESIATP